MEFKGLFIGIDRYESSLIPNLSCSVRDAQALYSLFCDAFCSKHSKLFTNEQATRVAIIEEIQGLQQSSQDDVVVIFFSGHGSDTHHLISHDADPLTLDTRTIWLRRKRRTVFSLKGSFRTSIRST